MSNAVVSMHNVCKKFSDLSLFSDLNLVANKGEIIAKSHKEGGLIVVITLPLTPIKN